MALTTVRPQGMGFNTGRRNMVINGAMQVAQRGTSSTGITGAGYPTVDRYNLNLATLGTWTASQSTEAPDGFSTSYKLECTVADASPAAADGFLFEQRIEAQNLQHLAYGTSAAKAMTLSFWVRSNKTGTYITEIQHGDAGSDYFNNSSYTIGAADTWEFKSIPVTGQTASAINNDNGIGFFVRWWMGAGSTDTSGTLSANTWHDTRANRAPGQVNLADTVGNEWYITGVQLEVGENASDFEHRSYGEELALCQRYYWNMDMTGSNEFQAMTMWGIGPSDGAGWLAFPCEMRDHPSVSISGSVGDNTQDWTVFRNGYKTITSVGSSAQNLKGCRIDVASSSQWAHSDAFGLYATNADDGAKFEVSAEL